MKGSQDKPKVFISYSWTTPQHEQWVLELAGRLSSDGIFVVLDKWDLKEGQDKHVFMEQMVASEDVKKVLVVCDKEYQSKADNRKGGVGTETQLISKKVYEDTDQEKFIPIIREHDESGKPCVPNYMASRIYIDLSSEEKYEENYQKLVRNLYEKPLLKRPAIGVPPPYITEDEVVILKTSHKVAQLKIALLNNKNSATGLVQDYFESFLESLKDFRIDNESRGENIDDTVISHIEKMLPLRDDFIEFTDTLFKYGSIVELETLHDFFEKLITFQFKPEDVTSWNRLDFDSYRFFIYELFLYFIAVLIKLKKYKEAAFFIHSQYFFRMDNGELKHLNIEIFDRYVTSLDEIRNKRLGLRRVSVTADMIKQRATRKDIDFNNILQADLLLHYIFQLKGNDAWFPRCSVYNERWVRRLEIFERLVSKRHFENIKSVLDVKNIEQLKKEVEEYVAKGGQSHRYRGLLDYEIPPLEQIIQVDSLCSVE